MTQLTIKCVIREISTFYSVRARMCMCGSGSSILLAFVHTRAKLAWVREISFHALSLNFISPCWQLCITIQCAAGIWHSVVFPFWRHLPQPIKKKCYYVSLFCCLFSESESEIFIRSFQTQETSAKTITGRCRRGHLVAEATFCTHKLHIYPAAIQA